MPKTYKPGTDNVPPGKYKEIGPRGGNVPKGHKATIEPNEKLPPTSKPGNVWIKK